MKVGVVFAVREESSFVCFVFGVLFVVSSHLCWSEFFSFTIFVFDGVQAIHAVVVCYFAFSSSTTGEPLTDNGTDIMDGVRASLSYVPW